MRLRRNPWRSRQRVAMRKIQKSLSATSYFPLNIQSQLSRKEKKKKERKRKRRHLRKIHKTILYNVTLTSMVGLLQWCGTTFFFSSIVIASIINTSRYFGEILSWMLPTRQLYYAMYLQGALRRRNVLFFFFLYVTISIVTEENNRVRRRNHPRFRTASSARSRPLVRRDAAPRESDRPRGSADIIILRVGRRGLIV